MWTESWESSNLYLIRFSVDNGMQVKHFTTTSNDRVQVENWKIKCFVASLSKKKNLKLQKYKIYFKVRYIDLKEEQQIRIYPGKKNSLPMKLIVFLSLPYLIYGK